VNCLFRKIVEYPFVIFSFHKDVTGVPFRKDYFLSPPS